MTTAYLKAIMDVYGKTITGLGPKCLYMYVHIFDYFSIYWSDTSLRESLFLLT